MKIEKLPKNIEAMLLSKPSVSATSQSSSIIKEGERNETLFKIGSTLQRRNIPTSFIRKTLRYLNKKLVKPPLGEEEVLAIAKSCSRYKTDDSGSFGSISDVTSEKVNWFWYPYFPRGSVSMIDGHPGRGKSYFTTALAALASNGGKAPFSEEIIPPSRILFLNAEDDPARTLRPRLERAGANLEKDIIRYQGKFSPLSKEALISLEAEISSYRPDLVIIDPLLTYAGGTDIHRFNDVTLFMSEIDELAREYDVCIIGVRHFTKAQGEESLTRGLGSMGFAARARSILQIGHDPEDKEVSAMAHAKSNYSALGATLMFELKGGDRETAPEFVWLGIAEYDASSLDKPQAVGRPSQMNEVQARLEQELSLGPAKIDALILKLKSSGFDVSRRTIQRALEKIAMLKGAGPAAMWSLKKKE